MLKRIPQTTLLLLLYRVLWAVLFLPVLVLFCWRLYTGKEHPQRWPERFALSRKTRGEILPPNGKLVWIHGASVGEALSVMPLIQQLQKHKDVAVLLTTGTRTSANLVANHFADMPAPERLAHQFIPLDFWPFLALFMRRWRPDTTVVVESELWPELMAHAKPLLINARIYDAKWPAYQKYRHFFRWMLSYVTEALTQREIDAQRLQQLGLQNAHVGGNLKYDAPPLPYKKAEFQKLSRALKEKKLLVFASTHPGEEEMAVQLHKTLTAEIPNLVTLIAPRHPHRGEELALTYRLPQRSRGDEFTSKTKIYLADTLGEMGLWYALAAKHGLVVMGGSLIPHGGHNPLEPLKLNCPTVTGAHMFNFKDMVPKLEAEKLVTVCRTDEALERVCKLYFSKASPLAELYKNAPKKMAAFSGASTLAKGLILERLGI